MIPLLRITYIMIRMSSAAPPTPPERRSAARLGGREPRRLSQRVRVPGGVDVAHLEAGTPRGMQLVPGGVNGVYLETWSPPRTRERRTRRACRQSS